MRNLKFAFTICLLILSFAFCSQNKDINVKKDFEYLYNVIEKCYKVTLQNLNNPNVGLNIADKIAKSAAKTIETIGKKLNSIILNPDEAREVSRFTQKYSALHSKHVNTLERYLNAEQRRRFVTIIGEKIALKMMSQLKVPGSSTEFFKKLFR